MRNAECSPSQRREEAAREGGIPEGVSLESMIYPVWRDKVEGGRYRVEAIAVGAGELGGQPVVFYSSVPFPTDIYARKLDEWVDAMEVVSQA